MYDSKNNCLRIITYHNLCEEVKSKHVHGPEGWSKKCICYFRKRKCTSLAIQLKYTKKFEYWSTYRRVHLDWSMGNPMCCINRPCFYTRGTTGKDGVTSSIQSFQARYYNSITPTNNSRTVDQELQGLSELTKCCLILINRFRLTK